MINETEKKGLGWFKGVLSSQNQNPSVKNEEEEPVDLPLESVEEEPYIEVNEPPQSVQETNKSIFSKDDQDKVALDVIVSLEKMLKDRQLQSYKNKALEDQLFSANEVISRLKNEQIKREQLLQEKNKEIRELENNLTNKQMTYDQLLEDYKEYQLASNMEYEKVSMQLETALAKYKKLNEESTNTQYQSMLRINNLEERIRNLEIENQKYAEQYQKIVDEKAELIQTINDFTERMSFSFSTKTTSANQ